MSNRLKRNAVVVTMALLVCAAAALNWKFSADQAVEDAQETQETGAKILGEATLVSGQEDGEETEDAAAQVDETEVYTGSDYFASARLTRQQARDSAVNLLQEAAAYSDNSKAAESAADLEDIVQTALSEAQIESLIIAKGYEDCVAYMTKDGISVAVSAPEGGLQQQDVAIIADVVMSQSAYKLDTIRVVEVK